LDASHLLTAIRFIILLTFVAMPCTVVQMPFVLRQWFDHCASHVWLLHFTKAAAAATAASVVVAVAVALSHSFHTCHP